MSSFWQFSDSQMAIFRRVRLTYRNKIEELTDLFGCPKRLWMWSKKGSPPTCDLLDFPPARFVLKPLCCESVRIQISEISF